MTVRARFDGKVIIPEEPLDLYPNQLLVLQIDPVSESADTGKSSALSWIADHAVGSDALPVDLAEQHDYYLYGCPPKDHVD